MKTAFLDSRFVLALAVVLTSVWSNAEASTDLWARYCSIYNYRDGRFSPGEIIQVRYYVRNMGAESSGPIEIDFYISKDTSVSADDRRLGSVEIPDLAATIIDQRKVSFTVPGISEEGVYYVGIEVTCANDADPTNNVAFDGDHIVIVLGPPDLKVQTISTSCDSYRPGDEIVITTTVENIGLRHSQSYTIDYYATQDIGDNPKDYYLDTISRSGIEAVSANTFDAALQLSNTVPEGQYRIKGVLTCSDDSDPGNNTTYSQILWVGSFADLAVQNVEIAAGIYVPGDEIIVYSLVENVGDRTSETYVVDYYVSTDTEITSRDYPIGYVERGGLAPGQEHSYETTCHLPSYVPAGDCYIGAIVTCPDDGRSQNNVGCDDATVTLAHPAGYICGRMQYKHRTGLLYPIRYAQVEIYEGYDEPGDPEIARTFTDADGYFGVVVPHEGQEDRPVFLKVRAQGVSGAYPGTTSTIGAVKDDVFEKHYFRRSSLCELPAHSSLIIDVTVPDTDAAFMVYDSIVEGFIKAKEFLGVELDPITTYWPSSYNATFYVPGEAIYIAQDDRTDRDVILHEYGHYLAEVCDFAQGSVGDYPQHYWDVDLRFTPWYHTDEQAQNFAFREAWPTLFSIATQYGDTWYPNAGDTKYQDFVEWATWTFEIDLEKDTAEHHSPGKYYENMNCCVLWDIFDDHNDVVDNNDILSDTSLEKIWTVTQGCRPDTMEDFWHGWFQYFDDEDAITRIFCDHEMPFQRIPTATGADFETGDFSIFDWVHGGDAPWFVTTEGPYQGAYCARSGAIGDSQTSTLKAIVPCESGQISFWRKVSSQEDWDKLKFYIDGWQKAEWSGEMDWEQVSYPVEAGTRTFMWIYSKSGFASSGDDTVWIDSIEFPTVQEAP